MQLPGKQQLQKTLLELNLFPWLMMAKSKGASFKFKISRQTVMNKVAEITYFGIVAPYVVFGLLSFLLLSNVISVSLFAFPACITSILLPLFMFYYRTSYLKNQFEPIVDKLELIPLSIFIAPLVFFTISAYEGVYVNPAFGDIILFIATISLLVFIAHIADWKSQWDKLHPN